jgi:mitogen-activated protein kinase kinase kinase 13
MAPEVIRNEPCSEKVDIWSYGVVLWELLTCEMPYKEFDSSAIIWGVGNNSLQLPIPATCPEGYKLLIKQCWSVKPKNRPSFRIILSHLEIAGAELQSYHEDYSDQQKTWQSEVREKMQSSIDNGSKIHEHEKDLIRKRQEEWKHAKDVRLIYEKKLQRTNDLYNELSVCFAQLEEREREIAEREKQIGTSKPYKKAISQLRKQHFDKISRRRLHVAAQLAQSNSNANSPSPPGSPMKTSMYVQLDGNQTKSVIQPSYGSKYSGKKTRHRRVGSGSSMTVKALNRKQYESDISRQSVTVDSQTQTDLKDLTKDETDAATSSVLPPEPKKIIDSTDSESDIDDNVPQDTTSSSQTTTNVMANSMATSIMTGSNLSYDTEDLSDKMRATSDDDNLESLRRKVNELIIETTSNIDSYSTNSSTNTIINRNLIKRHSKNCEKAAHGFSCTDLPNNGFVDSNKNIQDVKCSCEDNDDISVDGSIDGDVKSCSDDDSGNEFTTRKFNYSLRMKR